MGKVEQLEKKAKLAHIPIEIADKIDELILNTKNEYNERIFKSRDDFIRRALNRFIIQIQTGGKAE